MSDVIGEMLSKIGSIAVNSLEIQKEQEFAKAKKFVDDRMLEMSMMETPLTAIDTKEKYQDLIRSGNEMVYKELMSSVFLSKVPLADDSIREYIDTNVNKVALMQLKKYGKSAIKTTEALINSASNNFIDNIVTKNVSVSDSIDAIHNIIDKSSDTLGTKNDDLKRKMTNKIIKSALSSVDPYDLSTLYDINEAAKKYSNIFEYSGIESKLLKMISDAEGDSFQKELTNIIESKFNNKSTVFRSEKLRDAYRIIQDVKNMSVSEIRELAFKEDNREVSDILNRRAAFVELAMSQDSISFFESQEGVRQAPVYWNDADFVEEFARDLNKTSSMMRSIGEVSTVLSKSNKESLLATWKNATTFQRANISQALLRGSDAFQTSVLSNEIARTIPEMATYMELSSLDPSYEPVFRKVIDNDGTTKDQEIKKNLGDGMTEDNIKATRYYYNADLGDAIINTLKKIGDSGGIARKYSSWIDTDNSVIIPFVKPNFFSRLWSNAISDSPVERVRSFVEADSNNLVKLTGKSIDKMFVGGVDLNYILSNSDNKSLDVSLRNYGFGTYSFAVTIPVSVNLRRISEIMDENGNTVVLKLSEIIERMSSEE